MTRQPESTLKLDCDLKVGIFEIRCRPTFAGVLWPTPMTLETLKFLPAWHMRPFVILPKLEALEIEDEEVRETMLMEEIPHWRIDVWLRHYVLSDELTDEGASEVTIGSEMAVRFFRDRLDQPLTQIIFEAVRSLEWSRLAERVTETLPPLWGSPTENLPKK